MPGEALLPPPKESDPEDVAWALSTAEALWKRGELQDAVNWVRKAAEAASEADADMRVIELAKAASELSAWLEKKSEQARAEESSLMMPSADVEIDFEMSMDAAPRVELPAPENKAENKPPHRPAPPPAKPIPNATPGRLVSLPVDEVSSAEPEDPFASPPAMEPPPPSSDDSLRSVPSMPPAPPDYAPTPMAMPIAKSLPFDREPPLPKPKMAPVAERSSRTSTAPFGFPAPNETPSLANAALGFVRKPPEGDDDLFEPAIEVPQRPGIISPLPPPPASPTPALKPLPASTFSPHVKLPGPPRPAREPMPVRLPTPPMGSVPPPPRTQPTEAAIAVPPMPRVSLASSVMPSATGDDGVQSHVSDAPPRMAQSPRTEIPTAPRPPSILPPTSAPRISTLSGFPSQPPDATPSPASVRTIVIDPERFEVLADVPDDARQALADAAEKVVLLPEEAVTAPAMIIVLQGEIEVRAKGFLTRLDVIGAGQVRLLAPFAPAEGGLQVVGGPKGGRFLGLGVEQIDALRASAPWVVQELEPGSDDVHVVAGALHGKHGLRLDGGILDAVLSRAKTMRLGPDVKVVKQGENVRAFILLGAGSLSLRAGESADAPEIATLELGEIVFPAELLGRMPAPSTVRAGPRGALVVVATRSATEELLVTVPPLLELLGEG